MHVRSIHDVNESRSREIVPRPVEVVVPLAVAHAKLGWRHRTPRTPWRAPTSAARRRRRGSSSSTSSSTVTIARWAARAASFCTPMIPQICTFPCDRALAWMIVRPRSAHRSELLAVNGRYRGERRRVRHQIGAGVATQHAERQARRTGGVARGRPAWLCSSSCSARPVCSTASRSRAATRRPVAAPANVSAREPTDQLRTPRPRHPRGVVAAVLRSARAAAWMSGEALSDVSHRHMCVSPPPASDLSHFARPSELDRVLRGAPAGDHLREFG